MHFNPGLAKSGFEQLGPVVELVLPFADRNVVMRYILIMYGVLFSRRRYLLLNVCVMVDALLVRMDLKKVKG